MSNDNLSAMPADLVQCLSFWMGVWDEKSDLIPTDQRHRLAGDLDRMEKELQRFATECERRGIDGTPLNTLGELVSKTRREHPDPLMFSQSFRRYVSAEKVIELLRSTVQRLLRKVEGELEAADAVVAGKLPVAETVDTAGWPRVSQAAKDAKVNKGEISRACDDTVIHSVGKGRARRVDPASLKVWTQNRQRGREVRAAMGVPPSTPPKPQISSGICDTCGNTVTLRNGKGKCKCGSTNVSPLGRNVAQQRRSAT